MIFTGILRGSADLRHLDVRLSNGFFCLGDVCGCCDEELAPNWARQPSGRSRRFDLPPLCISAMCSPTIVHLALLMCDQISIINNSGARVVK